MSLKKVSSQKFSESLDKTIGRRIKMRRTMLKMTQSELASHINLTFQQVQKYENGINRISAGVLYEVAKALQVDVVFFYPPEPQIKSILAEEEEHYQKLPKKNTQIDKLIELYMELPNEKARRSLLQFIAAMVEKND